MKRTSFILVSIAVTVLSTSQAQPPPHRPPFPPGRDRNFPAFGGDDRDAAMRQRLALNLETFNLRTNFVIAEIETGPDAPDQIAILVRVLDPNSPDPEEAFLALQKQPNADRAQVAAAFQAMIHQQQPDYSKAVWMPLTNSVPIDLGPGDGQREIWLLGRWGSGNNYSQRGNATRVEVIRTSPLVVITNPTSQVLSQPMIELQGYSVRPVEQIRYDLLNAAGRRTNLEGHVNDQFMDLKAVGGFTTNFFTCYDIPLALGTNTIVLRCRDLTGIVATNVLTYVFRLEDDQTPPKLSLEDPVEGPCLYGDTFTARGRLDDFTAKVTAVVTAGGKTSRLDGLVERNGYFWVENIPLRPGTNYLSITATDAAGNSSHTNLFVTRSDDVLTIDLSAIPPNDLWKLTVTVTGFVSPSDQEVWVNGVQAEVQADGHWRALKVPVISPNGATAVFNATAKSRTATVKEATPRAPPTPKPLVAVQSALDTNAITLNATQPACAMFRLHLTGTAGRSFVLQSSTNLTSWTPILTNLNSAATFDYVDPNRAGYDCRFFRVVPLN